MTQPDRLREALHASGINAKCRARGLRNDGGPRWLIHEATVDEPMEQAVRIALTSDVTKEDLAASAPDLLAAAQEVCGSFAVSPPFTGRQAKALAALGEAILRAAPSREAGLDAERLAVAMRTVEVRSQMQAEHLGAVPAENGPLPDWYRAYAAEVTAEYARLAASPVPAEKPDPK